ncbi:MAG: S9 family peptidase [Methanobacteriota archaeon]|nr:MAG: S9 family peptidase [Euryarchaeota archaeon]
MPSKRKTIDFSSLFKAMEVQEFSIHPSGSKAVCSVNRGGNYELATLNLADGRIRRLLSGDQALLSPVYSPEGDRIAYQADFEGDEDFDIFASDENGRNVLKLTDGIADNEHPLFSPDSTKIAFVSNRKNGMENLYIVGSQGGPIKQLTNESLPVADFAWSPNGETVAFGVGVGDENFISAVNIRSGRTKKILSKRGVEYNISSDYGGQQMQWSSDGKKLLFVSNENDSNDIGELDLSTRKTRWLVRSKNDKYSPQPSPDNSRIAYLEVLDPNVVVKIVQSGRSRIVSQKTGVSRSPHWMPDGSGLVYVNGSVIRPEEMFVVKGGRPKRLTRFQVSGLPTDSFARPKLVKYRSFDGRSISAMLFVPKGRRTHRGVVIPHGGPEAQSLNLWDPIAQMFVMKGFSVILPNYRGSTGYGREFLHLHDKDLGGGDLKDVLYAGRYLLRTGLADDDKLGFWGVSYGGYMCMLALTKAPDMWAAGVSIVGYFDCITEFETERGYLKAYDLSKMGDPSENEDLYRDRSPIHFLQNLSAPVLLTASARDVRCPPTEAREVARRLKELGKEFEYYEYKDEGHWPRKRKNLKDLYTRTVMFLDERIPERSLR